MKKYVEETEKIKVIQVPKATGSVLQQVKMPAL